MTDDRKAKGRELLEKLCGNPNGVDGLPQNLRDYSLEHLFGRVWQGEDLELLPPPPGVAPAPVDPGGLPPLPPLP